MHVSAGLVAGLFVGLPPSVDQSVCLEPDVLRCLPALACLSNSLGVSAERDERKARERNAQKMMRRKITTRAEDKRGRASVNSDARALCCDDSA